MKEIMPIIIIINEIIRRITTKYLGIVDLPVKSFPQCLQKTALSWISSAQNGHFFIGNLLWKENLLINNSIK